jgi:hypothetical protein
MPLDDYVFFIPGGYGQPEPWEIRPPRKLSREGGKYWVPPGQSVSVAGRTIDGMVYVGSDLGTVSKWGGQLEPSLIIPSASLADEIPDVASDFPHIQLSYARMHPELRAAYLDWLAAGRPVGADYRLVALFLYGLERRILHDAATDESAIAETPLLLQEIERLADLYPHIPLLNSFLPRLQIAVQLRNGEPIDPNWALPLIEYGDWEMPPLLTVVLGQFIADRKPIPAVWALLWYLCHRDTRHRVVLQRCPEQFDQLFEMIYRERFGEGITVKMPRQMLGGYHHFPSSPSFESSLLIPVSTIPDVARAKKPVEQLNEVADQAIARLTPLSKAIGSGWNPESAATLALYPPELMDFGQIPSIKNLKALLSKSLGAATMGNIGPDKLLWDFPEFDAPPSISQLRSLGNLLFHLGYGLEPNPATARPDFNASTTLTLFRVDPTENASERDLAAVIALLDLGRHVAIARGVSGADGLSGLIASLTRQFALSPNDVVRLRAYLVQANDRPVSLTRLRKPLQTLDSREIRTAAPHFLAIGDASAPFGNKEIILFGKVYATLGLDEQQLHSDLHVRSAGRPSSDRSVPTGVSPRAETLDEDQVRAVREETDELASVLHGVFGTPNEAESAAASFAIELDIYTALLPILATRPVWSIADLRTLAEFAALPLAGAIERINDRAIALGLEPLLDCDDETCDVLAPTLKRLLAGA